MGGLLVIGSMVGTGCTTVPETGRTAFNIYSNDALAPVAAQQFSQLKQEQEVSRNVQMNSMLQRVGPRVIQAARQRGAEIPPPEQWEFVVFASNDLNAFAMPGGKVGFYEGIFQLFDDDHDCAVVVAHEVAHVVANHGGERVSQQMGVQLVGIGLALGMEQGEVDGNMQSAILAAYGLGSQLGVLLPYSRTHEAEADHLGLIYMAQAGYNPERAVRLWERMEEASGGKSVPEFLSTHPANETRVQNMREQLPSVMQLYEANRFPNSSGGK